MDQKPCMRRFVQFEDDGSPVLFDEETILFTKETIDFTFKPETPTVAGKLYITSRFFAAIYILVNITYFLKQTCDLGIR
jgi:hypothetical protein